MLNGQTYGKAGMGGSTSLPRAQIKTLKKISFPVYSGSEAGMEILAPKWSDWPQMEQIRDFFRSDFS